MSILCTVLEVSYWTPKKWMGKIEETTIPKNKQNSILLICKPMCKRAASSRESSYGLNSLCRSPAINLPLLWGSPVKLTIDQSCSSFRQGFIYFPKQQTTRLGNYPVGLSLCLQDIASKVTASPVPFSEIPSNLFPLPPLLFPIIIYWESADLCSSVPPL